jgi:putative Holliday junction resolvase
LRPGTRLGIDVGAVRIGVASCDRDGLIATPVETVQAGPDAVARIVALAEELGAVEVVVGLPLSLSGAEGAAAGIVREFTARLAPALAFGGSGRAVRLVDERLSTVSATANLRGSGLAGRKQRKVIDQAAAVVILQSALDLERSSGREPGELVEVAL